MWKSSIRGIILNQIHFSNLDQAGDKVEQIYGQILSILNEIAWFHRIPVMIIAAITTITCIIRYGKKLDNLNQDKRKRFINSASKFPFWDLLRKLISTLSLLYYFDNNTNQGNSKLGSPGT